MQKVWYKSRAAWGGLLVALSGVTLALGQFLQGDIDVSALITQAIPLIGTGLGILGIRLGKDWK